VLPVAVAWSSSDNNAVYYLLPVFLDDIVFSHNEAYFAFAVVAGCLTALYSFEGILVLFSFYAFATLLFLCLHF